MVFELRHLLQVIKTQKFSNKEHDYFIAKHNRLLHMTFVS